MADDSSRLSHVPGNSTIVAPTEMRFIRLGRGHAWATTCIETDTLRYGDPDEPHDLALQGDWNGAEHMLVASGKSAHKVRQVIRELRDFQRLGTDCLWVTFVEGRLWWGFADTGITDLRSRGDDKGVLSRHVLGRWNCRDLLGREILLSRLSARARKVCGYRGTFCTPTEVEAICCCINGRRGHTTGS